MKKLIRLLIAIAIIAVIITVLYITWQHFYGEKIAIDFKTEKIQYGDVISSISASGTVEPEELVNVGAQVNGKIMSFGNDLDGKPVDYGSKVTKGMKLAEIDRVLYDAALNEAKAGELKAKTSILSAEASLKQAKAKFALADRNWKRAQELHPKGALSKSDYDSAEANFRTCQADIAVAEAAVEQAKAQLEIAKAAMIKAVRNLSYCEIVSPVNGVIIDRRVSVGQTLVSSMSASSIFLIATDLTKMQVWASVNEADIGEIYAGMPVVFSVEAFPGETFEGIVKKVRLNATMSQNVVTYVVEINTDNSNGRLIPYLTANVKFVKERSKNAFNISNAALRYTPDADMVEAQYRNKLDDFASKGSTHYIWVFGEKGLLRPIKVTSGVNSGMTIEIKGEGLTKELDVVTAHLKKTVSADEAKSNKKKNPFTPDFQRKRVRNSAKGK